MLIDKAEIERVKLANDLAALVRARGVKLTRRGKQLLGLCPFNEDHEPSFIVDRRNSSGTVWARATKAESTAS